MPEIGCLVFSDSEAAVAVIAEKGYEGATMAEIAARSGTKIGSLYRFFPNKEGLADTIVVSNRENLDAVFDRFDAGVNGMSFRALADDLMALIFELFTRPALMKLLDAGQEWSVKREEFRNAMLQRVAKTLTIHTPNLPKKSAAYIALVILFNVKTVATYRTRAADAIHTYGGRYLARLGGVQVLEGSWHPNMIVIVEFPNLEQARAWYHSPEYALALEVRDTALSRNLILVDGVPL